MIAAIDSEENIVLKKEYRLPVDEVLIELPAGAIESSDQDHLCAAKRELLEETGYTSEQWVYLGSSYDCPDRCSAVLHLYVALNAKCTDNQRLDSTERIEKMLMPIGEAVSMSMTSECPVNSVSRLINLAYKCMMETKAVRVNK